MDTVNTDLIRGHVDTIILNAIMERDRYGYEILDIISNLSDGRYEIKQPTLYSCLKRLEKQGFITSYYGDESNGGRRRYYRITDKGRETVLQDQREWEFSRTIINRLLSDKEIDLATVEAPFDTGELRPLTRRVRAYDYDDDTASKPEIDNNTNQTVTAANENLSESSEKTQDTQVVAPTASQPTTPLSQTPSVKTDSEQKSENVTDSATKSNSSVDEATNQRIKERQVAASKLLYIGEFARQIGASVGNADDSVTSKSSEQAPLATTKTSQNSSYDDKPDYKKERTTEEMNPNQNYREALSAIYTASDNTATAMKAFNRDELVRDEDATKAKHFAEVKQSFYEDGYKLRVYQKANSANYYYMKYIYSNRINRDTAIFTYLVLLVELLVMIIAHKTFGSITAYVIIAVVGLLIPIVPTLIWAGNPTKRIKAKFNPSSSIINAIIVFIIISAIAIIVSLVVPSLKVDFTKGSAYVPYIIASNIPISVLIYGLLYKSNNYHLKK